MHLNTALDFICDVHDLYGLAEVFASTFFVNDRLQLTGGDVVGLRGLNVEESLVMSQVQVRFCTINGYIASPCSYGLRYRDRHDMDRASEWSHARLNNLANDALTIPFRLELTPPVTKM